MPLTGNQNSLEFWCLELMAFLKTSALKSKPLIYKITIAIL